MGAQGDEQGVLGRQQRSWRVTLMVVASGKSEGVTTKPGSSSYGVGRRRRSCFKGYSGQARLSRPGGRATQARRWAATIAAMSSGSFECAACARCRP